MSEKRKYNHSMDSAVIASITGMIASWSPGADEIQTVTIDGTRFKPVYVDVGRALESALCVLITIAAVCGLTTDDVLRLVENNRGVLEPAAPKFLLVWQAAIADAEAYLSAEYSKADAATDQSPLATVVLS